MLQARIGSSTFISWIDKAEKAVVDSVQTSSLPKHNLCEGFAALNIEYGRPLSERARAVLDAADDTAATSDAPTIATAASTTPTELLPPQAPDLTPLTVENCVGRHVLVPQSEWPAWPCHENNGNGWSAQIVDYSSRLRAARIAYTEAANARGIPYEDVHMQLHALLPA